MAKAKGGKKNQAEWVEKTATMALEPIITQSGYKLWDIVYEKEGAMWYLKVLFDKPDGEESIDDSECEEMTAPINKVVDTLECIELIDVLEVGSPGLNRVLRRPEHFLSLIGSPIKFSIKDSNGKELYIGGILTGYDEAEDSFTIEADEQQQSYNRKKCGRIILDL